MLSKIRRSSWIMIPAAFIVTAAILIGLLAGVYCLPQEPGRVHALESADYWLEHENEYYHPLVGDIAHTAVHNYADAIWVGIAAHAMPEHPFASLLYAGYYAGGEDAHAFDALKESMQNGYWPDVSYHRYWHGALVLIRPLLMVTGIVGIRWVTAGIYVLGLGVLVWMMKKRGFSWITVGVLGASLLGVGGWVVPLCLEYVFCFYVTIAAAIAVLALAPRGEKALRPVFVSAGVCMCFFDFFTAETLAFLMPAALYVLWRYRQGTLTRFRDILWELFRYGICYLGAYAAMFLLKWTLTSAVLNPVAFGEAAGAASSRAFGIESGSTAGYICRALVLNMTMVPWFPLSQNGGFLMLGIVLTLVAAGAVTICGKRGSGVLAGILAILAALPFARYLVLYTHSYQHAVFTYRAQWATVFCVVMMLLVCVQWRRPEKEKKREVHRKR